MEKNQNIRHRNVFRPARRAPRAKERGASLIIGGVLLFGLSLIGLALSYVSQWVEIVTTAILVSIGLVFLGRGLWHLTRPSAPSKTPADLLPLPSPFK